MIAQAVAAENGRKVAEIAAKEINCQCLQCGHIHRPSYEIALWSRPDGESNDTKYPLQLELIHQNGGQEGYHPNAGQLLRAPAMPRRTTHRDVPRRTPTPHSYSSHCSPMMNLSLPFTDSIVAARTRRCICPAQEIQRKIWTFGNTATFLADQ
jgi:hypothetical protein